MYTPPGTPRSRSFTRLTMRVGLPHLGQSVDFVVSMIFLRSAVFAILAIGEGFLLFVNLCTPAHLVAHDFNGAVAAHSTAKGPLTASRLRRGSAARSFQFI